MGMQSTDGYKEGWICGGTSDKGGASYCFLSSEIIKDDNSRKNPLLNFGHKNHVER
jgi:hypothetical protein